MPSRPTEARSWVLSNKATTAVSLSGPSPTFTLRTTPIPSPLPAGHVLLKTLQLSNDPAMRGWIDAHIPKGRLYVPPVEVGEVMRAARAVLEVVEVGDGVKGEWKVGQKATAPGVWSDYVVLPEAAMMPCPQLPPGIGTSILLGTLGITGITAYHGVYEVLKLQQSDVIVVSGAAGATGGAVVQLAKKVVGCKRVIGIAGGPAKCSYVTSHLGADACVDYRSPTLEQDITDALEPVGGFATCYYDNVGGDLLGVMLTRMATYGRIAACGSISTYNDPNAQPVKHWSEIIIQRLEVKGFIVSDLLGNPAKLAQARETLINGVVSGKIKADERTETLTPAEGGIEGVPAVWLKLFEGGNVGKLVTVL